jgi:hypothetical protein
MAPRLARDLRPRSLHAEEDTHTTQALEYGGAGGMRARDSQGLSAAHVALDDDEEEEEEEEEEKMR